MDSNRLTKPEAGILPAEVMRLENRRLSLSDSYGSGAAREPSLADYWQTLRKHRWTVVASVVILVSLALLISLRATPRYEAMTRLAINREVSDVLGFRDMAAGETEDWDYTVAIDTQVKVLQSDTLAQDVIQKLALDKKRAFAGDYVREGENPPSAREMTEAERQETMLGIFHRNLSVAALPNSRIVEVRFISPDPALAAQIANTLAQSYVEHNFRTKFESTMQTSEWLSKQLVDLQLKVETSQEKLVQYQKEHGILGIDEKQNIITAKLDELNKELTEAETDRIRKEADYRLAATGDLTLLAHIEAGSLLEKLRAQRADLQTQYSQLTTTFGPSYPKVLETGNQLKQVESAIQEEVRRIGGKIEADYQSAKRREEMLRTALENQKQLANQLNESSIQYNILKRDVETNRQLYEGLLQKLKEASVSAGLRSGNIRIVDPARVPMSPTEPNIPRNVLLALLIGLMGGIGLAFVREFLDKTVRTPEQVELVSALPSLGVIPHGLQTNGRNGKRRHFLLGGSTADKKEAQAEGSGIELVTHNSPKSEIAESYRALRTSILLSSLGSPPKVILVTSALPQEGKTTTSINTAVVLAQKGVRVLLIDADLRRPGIHRALGVASHTGLSNLLTGSNTTDGLIQPSRLLPNLFVLPAGPAPPHPAELLGSKLMSQYLAQWRQQYDHIVIDTPPTISVTDAVLLSVEADAVILVIRSGQTTKEALRRARTLLAQVNARVMGVVVNALDLHDPGSYYYHYGSKYGYYYHDNSEPEA